MKIISWNINGIRAAIKKGFNDFLVQEKPDIVCLQEIKISSEMIAKEKIEFKGYDVYWNSALRPGYSGTAILIKKKIGDVEVKNGMGSKKFDDEGRVQIMSLPKFYLVNVYFPNSNHELSRLDYKIEFNKKLQRKLKKLEKDKPVIITGDFNVAHQEIDLARPKENEGNPGYTKEEREWMTSFIKSGFVDTFRYLNGDKVQYSWWSYRAMARARNVGWRIDYFCVSDKLKDKIKKAYILDKITGSDHAPVGIEI